MKNSPRLGRGPWEERNWKYLEPLRNKASRAAAQAPLTTPERLLSPAHETQHDLASTTWPFERAVTLDLDEAPWPLPGTGWHVARRADGSTVWRRVSLQPFNPAKPSPPGPVGVVQPAAHRGTLTMLPKRKDSGNFLPIMKYDARTGRLSLVNRAHNGAASETVDVTDRFCGVPDLANLLIGWLSFPKGAAPDRVLVGVGEDYGERPSKDHREGVRVLWKLDRELGGEVREMLSTSQAVWHAIDQLCDAYKAEASDHTGELPSVKLVEVIQQKTANGTAFQPVFEICSWTPRPKELPLAGIAPPSSPPPTDPVRTRASVKPNASDMSDEIPF